MVIVLPSYNEAPYEGAFAKNKTRERKMINNVFMKTPFLKYNLRHDLCQTNRNGRSFKESERNQNLC
jgi:hypothetical protein